MKKCLLALLTLLCLPAYAQMGSHLKEEFTDPEKYGLRIVDKISGLRSAMHDESVRFIALQAFDESMPAETQAEALAWVRAGNTIWFYDARLASCFGMKAYYLNGEQFRHKPEEGVLGGSKRPGEATVTLAFGNHAVTTGVGQASVFLPKIELPDSSEPSFGAIEVAGDTVAVMRFAVDSPALIALRREGRGLIVYKSLLWTEPLSGDRLQANLLEFSAGFGVPGPAGQGKVGHPPGPKAEYVEGQPAVPLQVAENPAPSTLVPQVASPTATSANAAYGWELKLRDGTVLQGEFQQDVVEFETGTGSLKLPNSELQSLIFGTSVKLDKIMDLKGKSKSGLFLSSPLKFKTDRGVEEFEKEDLESLTRVGTGKGAKS